MGLLQEYYGMEIYSSQPVKKLRSFGAFLFSGTDIPMAANILHIATKMAGFGHIAVTLASF
jgi:hypothetical protein